MPHYKDQQNKIHFLDDELFEHLLPAGCQRITEEEAASALAPTAQELKARVQAQINALEAAPVFMNRFVREWSIKSAEKEALESFGLTPQQLYAANPGYKKIKDLDTQITALRGQL